MTNKRAIPLIAVMAMALATPAYAANDLTVPAVKEATVATPSAPQMPSTPSTPSVSSSSSSSNSGSSSSSSSSSNSNNGSSSSSSSTQANLNNRLVNVAGFDSAKQFTGYFTNLKRAVANGNRDAVAKRVSYPLAVNQADGKRRSILNEKQFLKEYNSIMTSKVRNALANQNVNDVFINYRGVMVGNGELWIGVVGGKPGIYAVNQ
ncbi:hypothetical protein [Paenibacillus hunanensis]|uniref:Uncharacterized protein n=1 Tax=Paenibacillus hunanensis TaxID=539262 RepID=A0ABU1IUC1_9BACL|nr:hypothetical protein [Paenibacillus hunanensis]MDR6242861.1 hypothetical protein [Paenibacillus hunanensis]GGJ03284.1 hypothetical protein GCM10008022_10360 [Paenibacillus hunanensis]